MQKKTGVKTFHNFDGECRYYLPDIVPYDEDHMGPTIEFTPTYRNDCCENFKSK
jgi:hypothetical protein